MSTRDNNENFTKCKNDKEREVRIWADGCYDVGHFGHANSLRQAKALGTHLTVGVHSDAEIMEHKGPPLFNEHERYEMIKAMRWVDDVVLDAPYVTAVETLDEYGCKYCAHGNDITTDADGNDTYQEVKDAGRYLEVDRTLGVSTTDIINRMLRLVEEPQQDATGNDQEGNKDSNANASPWTGGTSQFTITTQKLKSFGSGRDISKARKVVLAFGSFDVFNIVHIKYLNFARKQGDFLMVGLYNDYGVEDIMGTGYPIMTLHERVMSVLACQHVDDVIFGLPTEKSQWEDVLSEYRISKIVYPPPCKDAPFNVVDVHDARKNQIFVAEDIGHPDDMTKEVVSRVAKRREEFMERNVKKEKKEIELIAAKLKHQLLVEDNNGLPAGVDSKEYEMDNDEDGFDAAQTSSS